MLCTQSSIPLPFVHLFVRLSNAGIVSKRVDTTHIFKHYSSRGIIAFRLNAIKKSNCTPFSGGVKYTGVGKFVISTKSLFISEKYEIGPWLLWITNRKS